MSVRRPCRYSKSKAERAMKNDRFRRASTTCTNAEFTCEGEVGALGLLIYQAAKEGSIVGLRFALSRKRAKENIDYQDKDTLRTPLMVAAMNGHLQCVKLLLAYSADIHYSIPGQRSRSPRLTAASLATKHGHTKVAEYLQGCIDDLISCTCTRAHMEADVISIAENPGCTYKDGVEFCSLLHQLLDNCGYSLKEEDEDEEPSLLIRAAEANNSLIVYKLVEEFKVNPTYFTHPETAENVLHYACHNMSQLRFYIASRYRELLCIPDNKGNSPLHIACTKNDLDFVHWLFRGVLGVENGGDRVAGSSCGTNTQKPARPKNPVRPGRGSIAGGRQRAETSFPLAHDLAEPPVEPCTLVQSLSNTHLIPENSKLVPHETLRSNSVVVLSGESSSRQDDSLNSQDNRESCDNNDTSNSENFPESHISFTASSEIADESKFLPSYSKTHLPATFIWDMKLFRKNVSGESVLHLLASNGHSRLLSLVLKVAERLRHVMGDDELSVLTHRDGFTLRTPFEEGLMAGNLECVRLLIDFAENTKFIKKLFEDEDLMKVAVLFDNDGSAKNMEALKMLIGYGFKSGLVKSVTLADLKEQRHVTRLLLFYQTQVVNSLEFATVHPNLTVSLKYGRVKWEGFNLRHIDGEWLHDANCAVDSVSRIFHDPEYKVHKSYRYTQPFFRQLGAGCLSYFSNLDIPSSLERSYIVPIVEINLTENHLTSVPPELFQQHHLRTIRLSHNELGELPTSGNVHESVYSCPKLHKLELDWNELKTIPEELCRGVGRSLQELNLVHNKLTELPPGLWMMRKLKKLKLDHNHLTHLHRFSDPQYFADPTISQRVVMLFEAGSDGKLQPAEGSSSLVTDQEVVCKMKRYLTHLIDFLKTVLVMMGKDVSGINLAREVINIHWQRYCDSSDPSPDSHPPQCSIIDSLLDTAVTEDGTSFVVSGFTSLEELHLCQNSLHELPWDLPCVAPHLSKLYLTENKITNLDIVRSSPSSVTTLCFSKNQIETTMKPRSASLPCASPLFLLSTQPEREVYSDYCSHCQHSCLNSLAKLTLDCNQLAKFDLVHIAKDIHEEKHFKNLQPFTSIDLELLFPNVTFLNLASNHLTDVPRNIEKLSHLSSLNLSGNTAITELPEVMGALNPQVFLTLFFDGLFIKNIPHDILKGKMNTTRNIICYLKSIKEKSQTYRRIKLMVVGEDNKGKTSLLLSLTKQGNMVRFKEVALNHNQQPLATNGVELGDWEYAPRGKEKVTFMTWDFGGQEEYYATHQCFLTKRSLFLLVWNVKDGEAGLLSLRPWLENIEARARDSPVIVVATHADSLPQASYRDSVARLQSRLRDLYSRGTDSFAYARICSVMHVVNCKDCRHMEQLRNYIYNTAIQYCPPPPGNFKHIRPLDTEPLLEQKIPESFVKLQDIVRKLAHTCAQQNRVPIFTRQEYLAKVRESGEITVSNDELDQATSFLHSNGTLLHYDDSQLSDLYFVNPQWLCSMLANVVTVRERNPHVKDGIISMFNLRKILHGKTSSVSEVISIMTKFEVMLQLDSERLLIPSLLPDNKATPYVIMPRSKVDVTAETDEGFTQLRVQPPAPIAAYPDILVRYLLLPYIPNGFFPRLIARVLNSDLATQVEASLFPGPLDSAHILNNVHWECWRSGISLVWNHMEIVRIASLEFPLPNCQGTTVISNLPTNEERDVLKGMEIMIAVLPEEQTLSCPILPPLPSDCKCCRSRCMAAWLLQRATELADSVMEDWYEVFGFRRNINNLLSCMTTPCPLCFKACHDTRASSRDCDTSESCASEPGTHGPNRLQMFSLPFCCLQLKNEGKIACPEHGSLDVSQVAPDLVFADFAPSSLISNKDVKILQRLGKGGFGTVSLGLLNSGPEPVKVAVKELQAPRSSIDCHVPELEEETKSWHVYHSGSVEARMMYQLNHPHILSLLGLTLYPIRLVLELAKEDLSSAISRYHKKNTRLSRRTLKATLIQIADAMAYLHSKNILFRDLKPDNVLVWKFPQPQQQWNPDASVLIKLADYGISKKLSPQGYHSKVGTPQYLPPEVLLHSEHEAASLKVDVYSFGMVMYFLFAFKSPFGHGILVGSQLRNGRRPELPMKQWPNSLQLVELMMWCWSEKPNHRPSFDQILSILHREATYSLAGGIPVCKDDEIHSACVRTVAIPHRRRSSTTTAASTSLGPGQTCMRMSAIIPPRSCGIGMETGVEVWYGSITGKLGVFRYHSTGTKVEQVEHPSSHQISSIVTAGDNVWVASIGSGLWVYDTLSRQPVAVWGETERQKIYQLILIDRSVLALTNTGMYLFTSEVSKETQTVDVLDPTHHCPRSRTEGACSVGAYIPQSKNLPHSEIWTCAQHGRWLQVLSTDNLSTKVEVEIPVSEGKKIRHLESLLVQDEPVLFMADRHLLHKFDIRSRKHVGFLDCYTACWSAPSLCSPPLKQGRITSLATGDNTMLYVGNGAGMILLVNADTVEVTSYLGAYDTPVRCLFSMQMSETFSRLFSSLDTPTERFKSSSSLTSAMSTSTSFSSIDSVLSPGPESPPAATDNRSVLMSFGLSYRGIVGSSGNCPDSFILPSGLTSCPCCSHFFARAQPTPSTGYMLLWSRESSSRYASTSDLHLDCREENLDGSSE